MPTPNVFDDLPTELQSTDYGLISPDVIRTIIGEGDPAYVASVLANRKSKSGHTYDQLITDPNQFEARTGDAWSKHSKIAEDDPQYQKVLAVAGPILTGEAKPVTTADSFYSPDSQTQKGREKPTWDDGSGIKGPDGQLYFENKYSSNKSAPSVFDDYKPEAISGDIDPGEATALALDLERSKDNPNWPVYDPYSKVGRNADGSIAYVGSPGKGGETDDKGTPIVNISSSNQPEDIARWLKDHPDDIANKGSAVLAPTDNENGDLLAGGFKQGAANVKNSIEGGLNAVLPGHPLNNDLTRQLLNRQNNDQTNQGDVAYGLGKFTGETAATAPILAVPGLDAVEGGGALAQGARFLGGAGGEGSAILRGASLASKGALQGAETGALTSAGSNQDFGQQVVGGAVTGAVAAPAFHAVGAVPRLLQPKDNINPVVTDLADKAINKFGLDIRPDQIRSAADPVLGVTSLTAKARARDSSMLQSGVKDYTDNNAGQQFQAYKAVGHVLGLKPEEVSNGIDKDVIDIARGRTGSSMNAFTQGKVVNGSGLNDLNSNLDRIASEAEEAVGADGIRPILKQIKAIKDTGEDGGFTGDNYKSRLAKGSSLYNLLNSDNSTVRQYAGKIKDALDDAFENTHNTNEPDFQWGNLQDKLDLDKFRADRLRYKQIMTVAPIADKFGISGSQLLNSLPDNAPGDLGDLKKIGTAFYSHLDNGTPDKSNRFETAKNIALGVLLSGEGVSLAAHPHLAIPTLGATGLAAFGVKPVYNAARSAVYNTGRDRLLYGAENAVPNNNYFANKFSVPTTVLAMKQGQ